MKTGIVRSYGLCPETKTEKRLVQGLFDCGQLKERGCEMARQVRVSGERKVDLDLGLLVLALLEIARELEVDTVPTGETEALQ